VDAIGVDEAASVRQLLREEMLRVVQRLWNEGLWELGSGTRRDVDVTRMACVGVGVEVGGEEGAEAVKRT
jgi:hypothetical protein